MQCINKIRAARLAAGLTQKELCELIGMPRRTLEDWEAGRRHPAEWIENLVVAEIERRIKND